MSLGDQVTYVYILMILLYKVIGRISMMTLHLGVLNGEIGMKDRAWDHLRDVSVMISCSGGYKSGDSQTLRGSQLFQRRECTQRLEEINGFNR